MTTDYFGILYAASILAGGLMGFIKAGSVASLLASSVCAIAIAFGVSQNQRASGNPKIILAVSLILSLFFGNKFRKHRSFMPGLVMTIYSLISVIVYGRQLLQ